MIRVAFWGLLIGCLMTVDGVAQTVWTVPTTKKQVAFTFDDGPKPELSLPLLDLLDRFQVRATFFLVGQEAQSNIDMLLRLHTAGHELGNHTYTHRRLSALPTADIAAELAQTNRVIARVTGKPPRFFRPPGGQFNAKVLAVAASMDMVTVLWDVNAGDYAHDPLRNFLPDESRKGSGQLMSDQIRKAILQRVKPGSIILMHNGGAIVAVLPSVIKQLRNLGYEIVPVGQLLANASQKRDQK